MRTKKRPQKNGVHLPARVKGRYRIIELPCAVHQKGQKTNLAFALVATRASAF